MSGDWHALKKLNRVEVGIVLKSGTLESGIPFALKENTVETLGLLAYGSPNVL